MIRYLYKNEKPIIDKSKTVCFSGHRTISDSKFDAICERLNTCINASINNGFDAFICGGALGFDTLAAKEVISARKEYPNIKLILALPCLSQSSKWSHADKMKYDEIINNADDIYYLSENYYSGCMLARNRFMVDNSSVLFAFCQKNIGGTAYTLKYAKENNVHNINLYELI